MLTWMSSFPSTTQAHNAKAYGWHHARCAFVKWLMGCMWQDSDLLHDIAWNRAVLLSWSSCLYLFLWNIGYMLSLLLCFSSIRMTWRKAHRVAHYVCLIALTPFTARISVASVWNMPLHHWQSWCNVNAKWHDLQYQFCIVEPLGVSFPNRKIACPWRFIVSDKRYIYLCITWNSPFLCNFPSDESTLCDSKSNCIFRVFFIATSLALLLNLSKCINKIAVKKYSIRQNKSLQDLIVAISDFMLSHIS